MNLNNLKPAWQQFRLLNSMQSVDQTEILLMIERAEHMSKVHRSLINSMLFAALTICCLGG